MDLLMCIGCETVAEYKERMQKAVQYLNENHSTGLMSLSGQFFNRLQQIEKIHGHRIPR
jgi:hypothetical protein